MSEQQQFRHQPDHGAPPADDGAAAAQAGVRKAELDADIDSVLDDIDSVLEANAEEFVRGFVQKGGE